MGFKKYSPAIVCGFGAAVFSILPGVDKAFSCCLFLPAATGISLFLYKKINDRRLKRSPEIMLFYSGCLREFSPLYFQPYLKPL